MKLTVKILCFILSASWVSSSISGISYIDPIEQKPLKPLPGEDPCNPLYWYPRHIPEYCFNKSEIKPVKPKAPAPPQPLPVPPTMMPPVAIPVPYPMPPPFYAPMPLFPSVVPQFVPPPVPQFLPPPMPPMPFPYGVPLAPVNPMMPYAGIPYPPIPPPQQAGLVPGIQGLVSQDGGINILPFSDAYSDMLEKHKQKMIRKKLQKVLDDYEDYPHKRKYRKNRRWRY